jgi:hypothetical protein
MKKKIYSYFIQQTVASASEGELTIIFFFQTVAGATMGAQ